MTLGAITSKGGDLGTTVAAAAAAAAAVIPGHVIRLTATGAGWAGEAGAGSGGGGGRRRGEAGVKHWGQT